MRYLIIMTFFSGSIFSACNADMDKCFNNGDMDFCRKLCKKDNADACFKVCFAEGDTFACGTGCKKGNKSCCIKFKELLTAQSNKKKADDPVSGDTKKAKPVVKKDHSGQLAMMENECMKGNTQYCIMVGETYAEGKVIPKNAVKANEFFRIACEKKVYSGCMAIGISLIEGSGTERNPEEGLVLLDKACRNDLYAACGALGNYFLSGLKLKQDTTKAMTFLKKACEGNFFESCLPLARYSYGKMKNQKLEGRQIALWIQNACTGNIAEGCYALAQAYERGLLVKRKPSQAHFFYTRACELGFSKACDEKAGFRRDGFFGQISKIGVTTSVKACDDGESAACFALGDSYARGIWIKKDEKQAKKYLKLACENGEDQGCKTLKDYKQIYNPKAKTAFVLEAKKK
ncbi:sel1 repeat family protein [Myxococcota bacterium]|nr:sel1 repeat family protein [Myxococcota bacterium]MBU1383204.1 sel1 repeat family protein [Myxococcota bacterium]MBU1496438.1 sel1 repeat family protein [Myxococcota bacterium]